MEGKICCWLYMIIVITVCCVGRGSAEEKPPPQFRDCPKIEVIYEEDQIYIASEACNSEGILVFRVYEDCPENEIIFKIATAGFVVNSECEGYITYKWLAKDKFGFKKVSDAESKEREVICQDFIKNTLGTKLINAIFIFVDVNEFAPEPKGIDVLESIQVDENEVGAVYKFSYKDDDYGEAETLECKMVSGNGDIFEIVPVEEQEVDYVKNFKLNTKTALDFEQVQFYSVEANCTSEDARGTSSSAIQTFNIFVQDVGDKPPYFTDVLPPQYVEEHCANTLLFKVTAKDGDVGISNLIMYSIISGNEEGLFRINDLTGEVFRTKMIDREALEETIFHLEIQATEKPRNEDEDEESATTTVTVVIEDVNDNTPRFDKPEYEETIDEFDDQNPTSLKILNVQINVNDKDEGKNGSYTLTTNSENVILDPNVGSGETTFRVILKKSDEFDFDKGRSPVTIQITATEMEDETHSDAARLTIALQDINDNVPKFEKTEYETEIKENAESGTCLTSITLKVTDGDVSPEFGEASVVYSINGCEELTVNETTGEICLSENAQLDYEWKPLLTCQIEARDMEGKEGYLSSVASLKVTIKDVNDEVPFFVIRSEEKSIKENATRGTSVSTFDVEDVDTDADLKVTLDYLGTSEGVEEWFELQEIEGSTPNHIKGQVVVKGQLDRELTDSVSMKITAEDANADPGTQVIERSFTIEILDVNDENPTFKKDYSQLSFKENTAKGSSVNLFIEAEDPDLDDQLRYIIEENDYLTINEATGELLVKNPVDRESTAYFYAAVIVADLAEHWSMINISFTVMDVNDESPLLNKSICSAKYSVSEAAHDGTNVSKIEAQDKDEGKHGEILYILMNPNYVGSEYQFAPFQINEKSGEIIVSTSRDRILDREYKAKWQLIIRAYDHCEEGETDCSPNYDECKMTVTIDDVNDNYPQDYRLSQGTKIIADESLKQGERIDNQEILAFDPDEENTLNSEIIFTLVKMWNADAVEIYPPYFKAVTQNRTHNGIKEYYCILEATKNLKDLQGSYVIEIEGKNPLSVKKSTATFDLEIVHLSEVVKQVLAKRKQTKNE